MHANASTSSVLAERQLEGRKVYTVSTITHRIEEDLRKDDLLSDVWVEGEITGLKLHASSGHYYLSIKDERAQIDAIIFRNIAEKMPTVTGLKDGVKILARGDIGMYAPRGKYNFKIRDVRLLGKGDLYLIYEEVKKKLEVEGLFDPSRKKPIPRFPQRIGIVTSESGAALQDILNILKRRYPIAEILLSPSSVQGENAAQNLIKALTEIDQKGKTDVIIIGRGGGSMEDLWCFNDEKLARSIAASKTPIISAVGHETDFTIADFVADKRAPTPSTAAEIAAPDIRDLLQTICDREMRLQSTIQGTIDYMRDRTQTLEDRLDSRSPTNIIEQGHRRCDEMEERLHTAIRNMLKEMKKDATTWEERLETISPKTIIKRGYSLIKREDGEMVTRVEDVQEGTQLTITLSNGDIHAEVKKVKKNEDT